MTVRRSKAAGITVKPGTLLVFFASRIAPPVRSAGRPHGRSFRPLFSAASNAFIVGP
jgi:hypothetical protein